MKISTKKLKNGFAMPVFGLGTWRMGGDKIRNPENNDKADIQAIRNAIKMGLIHIDTAENYAEGYAEIFVGKVIKKFDRRSLFITSKVDPKHLRYNDVIKSAKNSLKRLGTDYLDLYLIHAPNDEIPLSETMKAMDKLVSEGLSKYIGVSNFKTSRLIKAQSFTQNKIVNNQVYYNLLQREPEHDGLLAHCQRNDVILTAYRPIDKGALLQNIPKIVYDMAKKYQRTPVQIMLNWLVSQSNVVTLSKMSKAEHLKENLAALGWKMDEEDIELLRQDYPNRSKRSELLPLR